jgi:ABC-2 type transport system ATP-binding protein
MEWLKFRDVNKSFPQGFLMNKKPVIFSANFSVREGRSTGFVGANGSGKTTLLKLALGFIFPDSGNIEYPTSQNNHTKFRKRLGYLPERPYYYDFLTAYEFLKMHWDLGGGRRSDFEVSANRVLKQVKLGQEGNSRLRTFSKGMLQRIGLAQALLHNPDFLILDEPMSGLDPDGRFEVRSLLKEQKAKGTTLFFSSHLIEDVEALCDDIIVISNGKIVFSGAIEDLKVQMKESSLVEIVNQLKVGGRS